MICVEDVLKELRPLLRLKDKVSVITGSGKGIGESIAVLFACEGSKVVVCSRTKSDLDRVGERIVHEGAPCLPIVADVTGQSSVDHLVRKVLDEYGTIDILVNNAGIFPSSELTRMSEQEWDKVIDTDLKSMFLCCKAVVPIMIGQKSGKIINVSSVTGTSVSSGGFVHYSAAKAGVIGFTMSLALELARHGINVNAISPGTIMTPGVAEHLGDRVEAIAESIPLKRLGDPIEVAYAALFLASQESNYITGQSIVVDGGNIIQEHK
jgi:3-oxoacyl-[acyl-carrier protein] reductase